MEALIVRLELSLEAAKLLEGIASGFEIQTSGKLTGTVPVHTKRVLEEQSENVAEILRVVQVAIANPETVEIPDPPE